MIFVCLREHFFPNSFDASFRKSLESSFHCIYLQHTILGRYSGLHLLGAPYGGLCVLWWGLYFVEFDLVVFAFRAIVSVIMMIFTFPSLRINNTITLINKL